MRYVSNGQSYMEIGDRERIPSGCHLINSQEYHTAIAQDTAGFQARRAEYISQRNVLRASARGKLMAGEPLSAEEADAFLG